MHQLDSLYISSAYLGCAIEEYNDHFIHNVQSSIYLAQRIGLPLYYRFRFYGNRFHSVDLQRDIYSFYEKSEEIIQESKGLQIYSKYEGIIDEILYFKKHTPSKMEVPSWLDLLAIIDWTKFNTDKNYDDSVKYIEQYEQYIDKFDYATRIAGQTRLSIR